MSRLECRNRGGSDIQLFQEVSLEEKQSHGVKLEEDIDQGIYAFIF